MATCTAIYNEKNGSRTAFFRNGEHFAAITTGGLIELWVRGGTHKTANNITTATLASYVAVGDTNAYIASLMAKHLA